MNPGETVSHYRILEKLGEGGMGVVYKAEDERLKRIVALKFLPSQQGVSDGDKQRFLREAQAAAALDHSNICTVYEIGEDDGRFFLAMAFAEGRPLDRRIAEGPLPLGEALEIARQTAEGLQAAHAQGVVHRDIKASNLMIGGTPAKPRVKILDFGLAQLSGRSRITQTDSQVGTVAYMSPEQTEGRPVDRRSDVWSLGVVLYEMVAGELPFKGHYDQATLYSILNEDPEPLTALRSRVPVELDWIVDKCLAKDPDERYQSVDDLLLDLTTLQRKLSSERLSMHRSQIATPAMKSAPAPQTAPLDRKVRLLWWAVGLLSVLAVGELFWALYRQAAPETAALESPVRRFDITLPRTLPQGVQLRQLAISPDGRRLAFITTEQDGRLWVRDFSQAVAWPLEGTEGAQELFWSPDSQTIGYFANDAIRKVAAQGGPSTNLAVPPGSIFTAGSWSPDAERIFFGSGPPFGIYELSSLGGTPKPVEVGEADGSRRGLPLDMHALEDSKGRVLLLGASRTPRGEQIVVVDPESGVVEPVIPGSWPFYSYEGYLFYQPSRSSEIWAVPFSLDERRTTGDAFPVAQDGRQPSVSRDGTLVYMDDALTAVPRRVVLLDRSGETIEEIGAPQVGMRSPALSDDGLHVAVSAIDSGGGDIWIHSEGRAANLRFSRATGDEDAPIWSPDGSQIVYASNTEGTGSVWLQDVDGGGVPEEIYSAFGFYTPIDWSADGETILLRARVPGSGGISYLRKAADGTYEIKPFIQGVFGTNEAALSPDGKFVVYSAREDGASRIYVQPFPEEGGQRILIAGDAASSPRWSSGGNEIFYVSGETLFAVPVSTRGGFSAGEPVELFSDPSLNAGPRTAPYDVSADGSRIALVEIVGQPPPPTIRVVLNWLAEFRR